MFSFETWRKLWHNGPGLPSMGGPWRIEMEYCASAATMLAKEFLQILEDFVEVPGIFRLKVIKRWKKYHIWSIMCIVRIISLKNCWRNVCKTVIFSIMWKSLFEIFHNVEDKIIIFHMVLIANYIFLNTERMFNIPQRRK